MNRDQTRKMIMSAAGVIAILAALGMATIFGPKLADGVRALGTSTRRTAVSTDAGSRQGTALQVYVTGAVMFPGVYEVPAGSRINDVVKLAGGLAPRADPGAINLASRVQDGMHLKVPFREAGARRKNKQEDKREDKKEDNKININTSSAEALCTLPGIGPSTAKRIMDYREKKGPFNTIEDIKRVSGIGTGRFEAIRDLITVSDQ